MRLAPMQLVTLIDGRGPRRTVAHKRTPLAAILADAN